MKKAIILGLFVSFMVGGASLVFVFSNYAKAQNTNTSDIVYDVDTFYVSDTVAAVSWKISQPADGLIEYGISPGSYSWASDRCGIVVQPPANGDWSEHTLWKKVDNLSPNTTYYFRIKAIGEDGAVLGYSTEQSFTTAAEAPNISVLAPTEGWEGMEISIRGSGFGTYDSPNLLRAAIYFGGANPSFRSQATINSLTDTEIHATLGDPNDPVSGPRTGAVTLYRAMESGYCYNVPAGIGLLNISGPTLTITDPPVITSIEPTSGPVGTTVTIHGSNLRESCGGGHGCNEWVYFGDGYVTNHDMGIESWTNTEVVAIVPRSATTGAIRLAYLYDSNDIDPGGNIISYNISGPTFTVTEAVQNANLNTNTLTSNQNINQNINTNTASTVEHKYGCGISTTTQNTTTIKITKTLSADSTTDKYLGDVYSAYYDAWKRYPRCDELQFHLDHSTPLNRLTAWLKDNATVTQTGDILMKNADIKLVEKDNVIIREGTAELKFNKGDEITFSGIATPNSTIKITVSSEPKTYLTTTNGEGYWTYTISDPLETGSHTAKVAVLDNTGVATSESSLISFSIIATAKAATTSQTKASEESKGLTNTTLIIIVAAVAILILVVFLFRKKPVSTIQKK